MLDTIYNFILKLYSKDSTKQMIKFAIVGAIGTIVNLSILFISTEFFSIYYIISEIIAFFCALINNYILNKIWTFKEKVKYKVIRKYFQYFSITLIALVVNLIILFILVEFFNMWYILAEIVAILGGFLINFSGSKFWTFNETIIDDTISD